MKLKFIRDRAEFMPTHFAVERGIIDVLDTTNITEDRIKASLNL